MESKDRIQAIHKVELHQHVDGSIPIQDTWDLMTKHGLNPVDTIEEMEKLLVIQPHEAGGSLLEYLRKFHYPLWVTQFYDNIQEIATSIAVEAYSHGVRILELRYAPTIHTYAGLTPRQAITSVIHGLKDAEDSCPGLITGLNIIAMRHMGPHIAKILARQSVGENERTHSSVGVIGFDIAGPENGNPPRLFHEAYSIARENGLGLTAHAGEAAGPEVIWEAIDKLGCERIGHACSAIKDVELLRRMANDKICVEVCVTSNYQTNSVDKNAPHPIFTFLEYGVPVAICTDNTTVSDTNQNKECGLLLKPELRNRSEISPMGLIPYQTPGLTFEELENIHKEAASYTFISRDHKMIHEGYEARRRNGRM